MATHRPEAALDLRSSTAAAPPIQGDEVSTDTASSPATETTNSDAPSAHPPTPPARPLRPPRGHAILVQPKHDSQAPPAALAPAKQRKGACGGVVGVPKSTCAKCTNISIMQLFYEMKQRFPTVSDEVVNECVLDYCHQRDRCMAALTEHIESNQTLIPQSYPSKSLRASAENILGTRSRRAGHQQPPEEEGHSRATCDMNRQSNTNTIPRRTKGGGGGGAVGAAIVAAAVPLVGMVSGGCGERMHNGSGNFRRQSDTNNQKQGGSKEGNSCSDMLSNGGSFISNNIQRMAIGGGGGGGVVAHKVERPCTLNLSPAPNRPFRTAPPIPSTTSSTSSLSSLSTATDLASASSPQLTASNESINVSVNVTLSPILTPRSTTGHVSKPPIPPRHTTELTVQPEMLPFATAMPTRSFTSVNFTLRQPASSAAGAGSATQGGGGAGSGGGGGGSDAAEGASAVGYPIDITTAGSSMTYSSSSYNAQQGYQSQLQITVGNGGGSISAIRTKAPAMGTTTTTPASAASNLMRSTRNLTTTRLDADTEEVLINRQLQSKWKLSTELDKYRKRLDAMQRDVKALEMPLPASAPDQLQGEIKRLQTVCDRMAAAVEEAGNFALGETNEAFYQRLDSQPGSSNSQRSLNSTTTTTPTAGQATAYVPGSPASGATVEGGRSGDEVEEAEGWICSKCTFQNHPELNMCEQCGMMKQRPPLQQNHHPHPPLTMLHLRHPTQQQQQPQQHQQPAGIVQITSSQFIPAGSASANANQTPAHLGPVLPSGLMPTNMLPYVMQSYQHHPHLHTPVVMQQSPQVLYSPAMVQYPSAFAYPPIGGASTANMASPSPSGMSVTSMPSSSVPLTPPLTSSRGSKGKRGSKFKSNLSQSISNLFSSSSSTGSNSHANSQE